MTNSADTLIINSVDHRYIFPAVLIALFGILLLYNVYALIAQKKKIAKLSAAEAMILEGHKKLVDNREELFVENRGALDANFMYDELSQIDEDIRLADPERVAREERKAEVRKEKRDARIQKEKSREERKKRRIEERKANKLTPAKERKLQAKKILTYEAAYNVFTESLTRELRETESLIKKINRENEKRFTYLDSKYKNKALASIRKRNANEKEKARKAAVKKKGDRAVRKAVSRTDISLFSEDEV